MHRRFYLIIFLFSLSIVAQCQTRNLEFYLKEGFQNSPLLNDYRNQMRSSVSDSLLIKAAKMPLIEARSMLQYSPGYKNFGYDEVITDGGSYTAVMGISQNIFNKKELSNKFTAIDLQRQSLNNSSRLSSGELNKLITSQYLTSFSVYNDLLFNKSFLGLFQKENEILIQFVKSGVCKQTDYLSLQVEIQSQEILVNQLKGELRNEIMLLNKVCGLNDTSLFDLEEPRIVIKGNADISVSPQYAQYKIDSLRIENEKSAIDIKYKPKVNWFADAGILTSNPWKFYRHFGYSAGVGLNIPVYDGKQRIIEKQKLEFEEDSRKMYQNNFYNQYFQQIQQFNNELKVINETSLRLEKQLKTSDQLVQALKSQLEAGIIIMTDYLNAIKSYRSINRNLIMMNIQKYQIINEMNFLLTQ
jgi:outer membrane protein TolC